jgi:hypothetical protein
MRTHVHTQKAHRETEIHTHERTDTQSDTRVQTPRPHGPEPLASFFNFNFNFKKRPLDAPLAPLLDGGLADAAHALCRPSRHLQATPRACEPHTTTSQPTYPPFAAALGQRFPNTRICGQGVILPRPRFTHKRSPPHWPRPRPKAPPHPPTHLRLVLAAAGPPLASGRKDYGQGDRNRHRCYQGPYQQPAPPRRLAPLGLRGHANRAGPGFLWPGQRGGLGQVCGSGMCISTITCEGTVSSAPERACSGGGRQVGQGLRASQGRERPEGRQASAVGCLHN